MFLTFLGLILYNHFATMLQALVAMSRDIKHVTPRHSIHSTYDGIVDIILSRLKHWSHQIVRFKNRRICKNLVFARSAPGFSTIIR